MLADEGYNERLVCTGQVLQRTYQLQYMYSARCGRLL